MMEAGSPAHDWIKAFHVVSIIAWMAGLLYLPRLFVYHCAAEAGSDQSETFKVMERRLMRAIMNPAMLASILSGAVLAAGFGPEIWRQGWFHVKLVCIFALIGSHMTMARHRRLFEADLNEKTHVYFRVLNEVPTLLMIILVVMAVVQPF